MLYFAKTLMETSIADMFSNDCSKGCTPGLLICSANGYSVGKFRTNSVSSLSRTLEARLPLEVTNNKFRAIVDSTYYFTYIDNITKEDIVMHVMMLAGNRSPK